MGSLKVVTSLILGLLIFLAALSYLTTHALHSHFLSEEFYFEHLSDNDAYNRLYDAVLVPEVTSQIQQDERATFLGNIQLEEEDVDPLVKEIFPPPELRRQVEADVRGAVEYLNEEIDPETERPIEVPNVYIDFRPIIGTEVPAPAGVDPIEGTAKPTLIRFLTQEMKANLTILPPAEGTKEERAEALSEGLADTLIRLQDPVFPITAPSLVGVAPRERPAALARAKELARAKGLAPEILAYLDELDEEINDALALPDSREALTEALVVATEPLVRPLIQGGLDEFRDNQLDSRDRFDPLGKIAKNRGVGKDEVLRELQGYRGWLTWGRTAGSWVGILAIVAFSILLGLLQLPGLKGFIGWPGLAILLSGAAFLGLDLILKSQLTGMFSSFLEVGHVGCDGLVGRATEVEPALCQLVVDVGTSMIADVTNSLIMPTIIIMIVGGALVVVSLFKRSPAR